MPVLKKRLSRIVLANDAVVVEEGESSDLDFDIFEQQRNGSRYPQFSQQHIMKASTYSKKNNK